MEYILMILFIAAAVIGFFIPNDNRSEVMEKYCRIECKRDILHKHCC
ncbi:MAG TPA: hypothetical protein VHP31_04905 [Caproicibacter sp.]|nr:hypothetical protein [Caproicibacter sp.]